MKQTSFFKSTRQHQLSHGGELRKKRKGRGLRPLSCKEPLHLVFKINKSILKHQSLRSLVGLRLAQKIIRIYAKHFFIKVEQVSIQNDHIHLLIRTSRRSQFQHFFRVVAGQIAQRFEKEGLLAGKATDTPQALAKTTSFWKHRPFTRVVRGFRAYKIVRDYIQLNEKEALKKIKYQPRRLRGLSTGEWILLWR